eukprot:scaffold31297_cov66-Cyclotella_meneghiniana.AAC.5
MSASSKTCRILETCRHVVVTRHDMLTQISDDNVMSRHTPEDIVMMKYGARGARHGFSCPSCHDNRPVSKKETTMSCHRDMSRHVARQVQLLEDTRKEQH